MKIAKYQTGGFMNFQSIGFLPEQQQQSAEPSQKQETKSATDGAGILDKEIVKSMLGKGITTDVMEFSESINNAYSKYASLTDLEKNTTYGRRLRSTIQGDLAQLNMLTRMSEELKDAKEIVKSNDANNELAITGNGVVVKNYETGELSEMGFSEYAKLIKTDKNIRALTNAQLIEEREFNRKLAFQTEPIYALRNATSIKKTKEEVWAILGYIGSTTNKKTGNDLIDSQNEETKKALNTIVSMAKEGVYDVSRMQSSESNTAQLQMAAKTMWENLSESSRSVLMARAASRGEENVEKAALESMVSLLSPYSTSKTEESTKIDFKPETGSGSGSGSMADAGQWRLMANRHGTIENVKVNIGNNIDFTTKSSTFGGFTDSEGKQYGPVSVSKIKELPSLVDIDSVTFGDQHVDQANLDSLVYTGDKVREYELPYTAILDEQGHDTGKIKPDFEVLEKINKAEKEMSKYGKSANAIIRKSVYSKYGIPTDQKGNPSLNKKVFVAFDAYGHSNMGIDPDSKYLTNVSDTEGVRDLYEGQYLFNGNNRTKANKVDRKNYESMFGNKDILRSHVFIPLSTSDNIGTILDKDDVKVNKPQNQGSLQVMSDQRKYNKPESKYQLK